MNLPPFPVDEQTLSLVWAAMFPADHEQAECSSLWAMLNMVSALAGSDLGAVEDEDDPRTGETVTVMRDPLYSDHDLIAALITEVRRLRQEAA